MAEDNSIVAEARKRFKRAQEFYSTSRKLSVDDTRFVMGDSDNGWQWPDDVRNRRETDRKVMLTVNMTAQHCNQIINNIRMNRPAAKVLPADDNADKRTAEILGGLIRQTQASSCADEAHDTAAEHAIYGGEGYWRVVTDYESDTSFNQCIKILACPNPLNVFIDPDAKKADRSDAKWGMIFDQVPKADVKRDYKIDAQSFESIDNEWVLEDTVLVAEYFYREDEERTLVMLADGSTAFKDELPEMLPDGIEILRERSVMVPKWKWCKLIGGSKKPVDEREWLGRYLPIITVVGKELNVNGKVVRKGIVRDLKDPQRMVNYAYSETVQSLALQNKIPYVGSAEAIEGHEDDWENANIENKAILLHNAFDDEGNPLNAPQRQALPQMAAAQVQLLQLSTEQMRAASGQQNANFGIKSEAASGVGIQRLKAQGEIATFHFPDNLARALHYEAVVLIDLYQKYYDAKRVVRILGLDGKEESATLDPQMDRPYDEGPGEEEVERIFNPTVGMYDVVIDTGPSYQTQRQEAAAHLNELAAKNPQLMQVAGDIVMRAQDFPMADKLADRLAKTIPPELREEDKPGQQIPPQAQAQIQRLTTQLQQLDQAIQGMEEELSQTQDKQRQAELKAQMEESKRIKVETENYVLKAGQQLEADKQQAIQEIQASVPEPPDPQEQDMQTDQTGPLIEALLTSVQEMSERQEQSQAVFAEQVIGAIQETGAQTLQGIEQLAQTLMAERMQPRTVRTPSGRTIQYDPATGEMQQIQ